MRTKIILIIIFIVFAISPIAKAETRVGIKIPDSLIERYTTQLFKRHPKICKTMNESRDICVEEWTDKQWMKKIIKKLVINEVRKQDRIDRKSIPINTGPNDYNDISED